MLKTKAIAHICNLSTRRGCGQRITKANKAKASLNCVVRLSQKRIQYIKIDFNYLYDNSEENRAFMGENARLLENIIVQIVPTQNLLVWYCYTVQCVILCVRSLSLHSVPLQH